MPAASWPLLTAVPKVRSFGALSPLWFWFTGNANTFLHRRQQNLTKPFRPSGYQLFGLFQFGHETNKLHLTKHLHSTFWFVWKTVSFEPFLLNPFWRNCPQNCSIRNCFSPFGNCLLRNCSWWTVSYDLHWPISCEICLIKPCKTALGNRFCRFVLFRHLHSEHRLPTRHAGWSWTLHILLGHWYAVKNSSYIGPSIQNLRLPMNMALQVLLSNRRISCRIRVS